MCFHVERKRIIGGQVHKLFSMFVENFAVVNVSLREPLNVQPRALARLHDNLAEMRSISHRVFYFSRFIRAFRQQ